MESCKRLNIAGRSTSRKHTCTPVKLSRTSGSFTRVRFAGWVGGGEVSKGQICRTQAESQQIVGQSLLSCLQYPVLYSSRLQEIYLSQYLEL